MSSVSNIGNNNKDDVNGQEISDLNEKKIPICSKCKIVKPPSTACEMGHMLCFDCGYSNNHCPCLQDVQDDGIACGGSWVKVADLEKHYFAYETNAFPCRNNWVGCSEVMMGHVLDLHGESKCQFRPVARCPLTPCPKRNIHVSNYMEHLKKDHTYVKEVETDRSCVISSNFVYTKAHVTRSYRAMSCFGGKFLNIVHDYEDRIAYWVHVITKPANKDFKVTIKIPYDTRATKKNGKEVEMYMKHNEIVSTHIVHSLNTSYEEILAKGECVDIPKHTFEFPPGMREALGVQPTVVEYIIEEAARH